MCEKYRDEFYTLQNESKSFQLNFTDQEYKVLNLVINLFGSLSANDLSELNHTFRFWKEAYQNGLCSNGYHDKAQSKLDMSQFKDDIEKMAEILKAYKLSHEDSSKMIQINNVIFYYDFEIKDEIKNRLQEFSLSVKEGVYTVYFDDGKMVIY
ncbi:SocA family protein [Faecalicoccus pleomorphus]|uniref:SocA family protein n=1 Tax=Faecalicoccus pleomorphus TaxID=1323 RepID=A0A7X9NJ00_9FIRM|nr:hypothetical protein [Faecalicoccus pleomorphus]NME45136.1 SocA family protein [Faecalicoccus pleomorphus]